MSLLHQHPYVAAAALTALVAAALLVYLYRRRAAAGLPLPFRHFPVERFDAGDGWEFRVHRSGRGPALLLLHGIGANLYCWRQIAPILARHHTVIAPDLPGFGQSSKPKGARYGLDDQVPRVIALLDRLKIGRVHVVGNSMGGNIALWLALKHPERVAGVAVIAPATSRKLLPFPGIHHWAWAAAPLSFALTRRAMGWAHRRTVSRKEAVDRDRIEETFRTYARRHPAVRSFLLATRAIGDKRLPEALRALEKPVLILYGAQDRLVTRQVIDELKAALPAAESHVHESGGHHLQEDEPAWVAEKLLAFLRGQHD